MDTSATLPGWPSSSSRFPPASSCVPRVSTLPRRPSMRCSPMPARSPELRAARPARLSDSLPLILPAIPPKLVVPERLRMLEDLAGALAPVHCAGFECRLAAGDSDVDIQQGVTRRHGEPETLVSFLAQAETNDVWERVLGLAKTWSEDVAELWLEVDADADTRSPALADLKPSVFALLRTGAS